MNLTVGPHPPAVYWRRRAIIAAPILLILLLFASCVAGGGSEAPRSQKTAQKTAAAKQPKKQDECTLANPCETVVGQPPAGAAANPSAAPVLVAPAPSASSSTAPNAGATDGGQDGVQNSAHHTATAKPCADGDISVTVQSDRTSYRSGTMPKFTMVIANTSSSPCTRDVGASHQELRVVAGGRRIWSSDDCTPNHGDNVVTLKAGEKQRFWLTWSGMASTPGCPKPRAKVPAGTYQLVGHLEHVTSSPLEFTVTT